MRIVLALLFTFAASTAYCFDHSHSLFDEILKTHVKRFGRQTKFNYQSLKKSPQKLLAYLEQLSKVPLKTFVSFTHDQRLAFLINAYNAFTIKLIIDNYPLEGIKDIGGWFGPGPWKKDFVPLFGEKTNLDYIEHELIRKGFNEPRIHFAVNCASIGCPSLRSEAYVSKQLNAQLQKAAINFLINEEKNRYDSKTNTLYISKIFKWYGKDFVKVYGSVKNYVADFLSRNPKQKSRIRSDDSTIKWTDYDWKLNEWK